MEVLLDPQQKKLQSDYRLYFWLLLALTWYGALAAPISFALLSEFNSTVRLVTIGVYVVGVALGFVCLITAFGKKTTDRATAVKILKIPFWYGAGAILLLELLDILVNALT